MNTRPAILIVDDTIENRRLYAAMLANMDVAVVAADGAAAALRECQGHEFAMILLDVSMPDIDGFEAARLLRQLPLAAHTPIVFVSAVYTRDADAYSGYREGAVDYIVSPVVSQILRAKVAVFTELYRKKLEAQHHAIELASAHRALQAAYGELESFSYCAAHDLRSPLMQIAAFTRFLVEDHSDYLDQEGRDHLGKIATATVRMNTLIDDLLALAKLVRTSAQHEEVDLSALAAEITADLDASGRQRHVDWHIAPGLSVRGDSTMLRALLHNLLGNAWKYTGKTAQAVIQLGVEQEPDRRVFYVRDNGAGFDMAHAAKLFMPFERLHGQGEFPGTGIGLAIVERIVAKHGGEIRAEAARGKGATFYFTLEASGAIAVAGA